MRRFQLLPRLRRQAGFTAIEISAVAAIIAILTLILVPIVRNQVAKSKIVAAQDDMFSIAKGEEIAHAETGQVFRVQDLILGPDDGIPANGFETPLYTWNLPLQGSQIAQIATSWDGPYLTMNRKERLDFLTGLNPFVFRSGDIGGFTGTGPILVSQEDLDEQREYPVDPWGSPYILFGPGQLSNFASPALVSESTFNHGEIYSLGPDGRPGLLDGTNSEHYYPDRYRDNPINALGDDLSDDLSRTF